MQNAAINVHLTNSTNKHYKAYFFSKQHTKDYSNTTESDLLEL